MPCLPVLNHDNPAHDVREDNIKNAGRLVRINGGGKNVIANKQNLWVVGSCFLTLGYGSSGEGQAQGARDMTCKTLIVVEPRVGVPGSVSITGG